MNNGVCRRNGDWNQTICCGLASLWTLWLGHVCTRFWNTIKLQSSQLRYILWIWEELKNANTYCCLQFGKGDDERQPVLLEIFNFLFFMFKIVHHKWILFIIRRLGGPCLSTKDRKSVHGYFRQTVFTVLVSLLYYLRSLKFSLSNTSSRILRPIWYHALLNSWKLSS